MSARALAPLRRWLPGPAALLVLLAAVFSGPLHRDGLHERRSAGIEAVSSGCEQQHPPRFEPRLSSHRTDCPGCLLQLHRGSPDAQAPVAAPLAPSGIRTMPEVSASHASHSSLLPSPRGPPALVA